MMITKSKQEIRNWYGYGVIDISLVNSEFTISILIIILLKRTMTVPNSNWTHRAFRSRII